MTHVMARRTRNPAARRVSPFLPRKVVHTAPVARAETLRGGARTFGSGPESANAGYDLSLVPARGRRPLPAVAEAVLEVLRDDDAGTIRSPDAGVPAPSPDAGVAAPPTFPTYAKIVADKTVATATAAAWAETKKATTSTSRREQGFWITYDTAGSTYTCAPTFTGSTVGKGATGAANPGTKPADSGKVYTVGLFHTHTPMTYRDKSGVRDVGPSSTDNTFHTNNNVAGVVYDYVESPAGSGTIPGGHPIDSAAKLYSSGPTQRT